MKRSWWYRFSFLLVFTVISVVAIIPTVFNYDPDTSNFPVKSKISLGLDLQGGLYMILGIDFNKVYKDEIKSFATRKIIDSLKSEVTIASRAGELNITDIEDPKYTVVINNIAQVDQAKDHIRKFYGRIIRLTAENGNNLEYGLSESWKREVEDKSVTKSIEVIRNRIDEFGVTEPEIISQGKDRIIVQLPGVKDIDRAKDLIGKTAKLEFKIVNDTITQVQMNEWIEKARAQGIEFKQGMRYSNYLAALNEFLKKDLPKGYVMAFQKKMNNANVLESQIPFVVEENSVLGGDDLQEARVQVNQQKNEPYVSMSFKTAGTKRFDEITGANVGKRLAIVLDGNVYSAPNINERISGGNAQISLGRGNATKKMKEASDIALVLRAGALPVQLDFLEQRIVGPSLGHDSIEKAQYASIIGCLLVFIFIVIYYKVAGVIALVSLSLNILFILCALVGLGATLTLPGIAGIALTIGMAVDANIIIYERIREERRKGVSNYKAVENGFSQAFWTILDANITTALAGICLLNFGTGPIRGFAVTLLIGIMATVYTSYFVGKLFFEFYMNKVEGQDLSI